MKEQKNSIVLILASLTLLILSIIPGVESIGLDTDSQRALSLLLFFIILWATEAIPFPVTGLLALILLPILGLQTFAEAATKGYGNPIIAFFISIMVFSAALKQSGLTLRLTLTILDKVGFETHRLILVFLTVGAFFSMWITNMGVAALLLPIACEMLDNAKLKYPHSNFGKALMISIAWGCGIGGMGTPIGTGANLLAVTYMNDLVGTQITFWTWMKVGLPAIIILLPAAWFLLGRLFPYEIKVLPLDNELIKKKLAHLGTLSPQEKYILIIFIGAILAWLAIPLGESVWGIGIPLEIVAVIAAFLTFLPPFQVLKWKDAQEAVNWGAIVLIAGGLSLGQVLLETGSAHWLAQLFATQLGQLNPLFRILLIVLAVQVLKMCFSSNTATGLVIIPILILMALESNLDVWGVVGPAALAIPLAFILVPSSPTNVIPYEAGYFKLGEFAYSGLFISLLGALAITFSFLITGI